MNLSKQYLESISTSELLKLADIYGLFIPNGLNRNFIIAELLELDESDEKESSLLSDLSKMNLIIEDDEKKSDIVKTEISEIELVDEIKCTNKQNKKMKLSYNSTEAHIILRDPMWLFAFWDFSRIDYKKLIKSFGFDTFILRVLLFYKDNKYEPYEYYDIEIEKTDRNRYFYLSFDDELVKVAICVRSIDETITVVSESNFIYLNRLNIPRQLCSIGASSDIVADLSGLSILKKSHFKNYRQAFRDIEEYGNVKE